MAENEREEENGSKKRRKKTGATDFDITYEVQYNENDIDLSLNLKNPAEDRFFAYSLTLMDLYETMSDLEKHAPKEIIDDFLVALKIIKAMAEAVKSKIEIKAGLMTEEEMFAKKLRGEKLSPENKEKLKKLISKLKGSGSSLPSFFNNEDKRDKEDEEDEDEFKIGGMEGFAIETKGKSEAEIEAEIRKNMEEILKKISRDINGSNSEPEEKEDRLEKDSEPEKKSEKKPKFLEDKFRDKPRNEDIEL